MGEQERQEVTPRKGKLVWVVIGVVGGAVLGCLAVALLFIYPYLTGSKVLPVVPRLTDDNVLIASPGRRGTDLYLLKLGQDKREGKLLAEDVRSAQAGVGLVRDGLYRGELGGDFGGFVPGLDWLFLWYRGEEKGQVCQMRTGDDAPVTLLEYKGGQVMGAVMDHQRVFLAEYKQGRARCYVARPGHKARRLVKADGCHVTPDGAVLFWNEVYGDETTLAAIDLSSGRETLLLNDAEGIESYRASRHGDYVAYVQEDKGDRRLYMMSRGDGKPIRVSDEVAAVVDYDIYDDALFYIVREDRADKTLKLYTSESSRAIASGSYVEATFTPDGRYLVYLVAGDDESAVRVHPMGGGEEQEVWRGEGQATFEVTVTSPPRIVVAAETDGGLVVTSAATDGTEPLELLRAEGSDLKGLFYVYGEKKFYILVEAADGGQGLFVTPIDRAEGVWSLQGWQEIALLNRSSGGGKVVFWGREDADRPPALYAVAAQEGATPVVLDDEHQGVRDAVFTPDGRAVIYTALLGRGPEDVDVCRVAADGESPFAVLYEKSLLVDVHWDNVRPFRHPALGAAIVP